jgi:hypothetical protein
MKKTQISIVLLFTFAAFILPFKATAQTDSNASVAVQKNDSTYVKSAAYEWLDVALEATAREHARVSPRPTVGSRMLMIITTAMYDAWANYDEKAVGTRLGGTLRRPKKERTEANKRIAIAYATYRAMLDLFPEDKQWLDEQMRTRGYDPNDTTTDVKKPQGIANVTTAALLEYRHRDGANQLGDELGGNGKPYSDYTFYRPVNSVDKIVDPDCWQPITFQFADGKTGAPGYLTPQWYRVKPVALERADQFRPPPPKVGSYELKREVDEVLNYNGNLSPEQKAIVEFMRDGPRSTGQSGHWLKFAQAVSHRDKNDVDQDVKMYFAVGAACFDAFIAAWESKRFYDSSRPWTLIRHYYKGQKVNGWAGPGKGVVEMPAEDWHPYSPYNFITPPFPGYVSGHSCVSAAAAKTLELFTGSDRFGEVEKRKAGMMTEAEYECKIIQTRLGQSPSDAKLTCEVALDLPTFSATAEMAGLSRVMGGYHIQADNVAGLDLGRKVSTYIFPKIKSYFDGTATVSNDLKMTAKR